MFMIFYIVSAEQTLDGYNSDVAVSDDGPRTQSNINKHEQFLHYIKPPMDYRSDAQNVDDDTYGHDTALSSEHEEGLNSTKQFETKNWLDVSYVYSA